MTTFLNKKYSYSLPQGDYSVMLQDIKDYSFPHAQKIDSYLSYIEQCFPFATLFPRRLVKLVELERRTDMPRATILSILEEAGFNVPNKGNASLSHDHVLILAKAYEKSLKQLYKKTRKTIKFANEIEFQNQANFFRPFIKNDDLFCNDHRLFDQELNSQLIENWFYSLATTDPEELSNENYFYDILRRLKFKLLRLYKDTRAKIFSIVISHHYHIFPGEEDHSGKANINRSFSGIFFKGIRKAIINKNFIKAFNYDKNRTINLQYNTERFIS